MVLKVWDRSSTRPLAVTPILTIEECWGGRGTPGTPGKAGSSESRSPHLLHGLSAKHAMALITAQRIAVHNCCMDCRRSTVALITWASTEKVPSDERLRPSGPHPRSPQDQRLTRAMVVHNCYMDYDVPPPA